MTLTPKQRARRTAFARDLRHLADVIEKYHYVPLPYDGGDSHLTFYFNGAEHKTDDEAKRALAAVRRLLGGKFDKDVNTFSFSLRRGEIFQEYDGLKVSLSTNRENVCERRVIGTKTTEKPVYDSEPTGYETVTEDVVEWICPEVLS